MIEQLQKIGLTSNESKIYLALLKLNSAQAGRISKESQINRTTTYDVLERLIEKGLVNYSIISNKKLFKPVSPKKILENIKEKEETIKEILPELEKISNFSEAEESNIYKGKKGIKTILNEILKYKEYVAFGSSGEFEKTMKHDFELFQNQKKKLKIKSKVILPIELKNSEIAKISYAEIKYFSDEFSSPTTTFIYGSNTAIIIWAETPIAILIKSNKVAKSYKQHFELLWKIAKK